MAKQRDPDNYDYLAVVSEWSSTARQGGLVGNAYPILNLTLGEVVTTPRDDFPNPGAVFLLSRGQLKTWDFVILRPRQNDQYRNDTDRACYYIPARAPELVTSPNQVEKVAVILDHPAFDLTTNVRHLLNPAHNVTPYFFVRKEDRYFGPLCCVQRQLSPAEDLQRIDWRPARDDGIVYEFSEPELTGQGLRLSEYRHPDPYLNRVIYTPIGVLIGSVRKAASGKPWDALTDAGVIEWYLQRCHGVDIPPAQLEGLKGAFQKEVGDDQRVVEGRLKKIERDITDHTAFLEYRDRIVRQYLESDSGRRRIQELVEQTVAKKAEEIQNEVDRRHKELAAKRDDLARQLADAEREHAELVGSLQTERESLQRDLGELQRSSDELKGTLASDAHALAAKMREQLPLIAALTEPRREPMLASAGTEKARASGHPVPTFAPIPPAKPLATVKAEATLVNDLHAALARAGLHFSRDFVGNVYTCLKSESLNLIIGPPGYGKSMLVTALARALGHGQAFLPIAVRRSWAEDRYLLGAFDSFNGRYDPGPTGLVARMLQAEADWKAERTGIYLVLLDEFNLAAPEYYFSQLLQTLPSDDAVREVRLYDPSVSGGDGFPSRVALGPNIRFWGTINYDETTERLSPRALDRTGMIFLGETDVLPTVDDDLPPSPGVAASEVFGKFLRTPEDCPEERWQLVSQVIDLLRSPEAGLGPRVELSPRVRRGIQRYLANSVDVLPARVATDFVIQQRILPVVRGRGDDFLVRVRRLAQLLGDHNFPRSAQHVEEAIGQSEQRFNELDFLSY